MELARQNFSDRYGVDWSSADSSTSNLLQIDLEVVEDTSDRYTYTPVQTRNLVLISCEPDRQRATGHRSCKIEKSYWWHELSHWLKHSLPKRTIVYEGYEEYLNSASEDSSTMYPFSDFWGRTTERAIDLRGTFFINYRSEVIFAKSLTLKIAELPHWKPKAILGKRTIEVEDA
jgi:hypothetical protein